MIVMGRSRPVPFYEIVGLKEHVSPQTHECLAIFAEGMTKYFAQDWEGALACFARSELLEPNVLGKTPGVVHAETERQHSATRTNRYIRPAFQR